MTADLLAAWRRFGILHADLAIRRPSGAWWAHPRCPLDRLPLTVAAAANARRADIYARPARGLPAAYAFLDDLPLPVAIRLIATTAGCAIHTSKPGGCQVWLALAAPIDERQRTCLQRHLAQRHSADPASISGDHYGRLPGFRNWKRGGCWVALSAINLHALPMDPGPLLDVCAPGTPRRTAHTASSLDHSAQEWGWVCGALEHGMSVERIRCRLLQRARVRRGADAERYVDRTLRTAIARRS